MICVSLLQCSLLVVSIMFVGHLGEEIGRCIDCNFVHYLDWHKHALRHVISTGNTVWASVQGEAVPHVGNPFTECNFCVVLGEHPHCHALVEHGFSAQVSRSRPLGFGDGGALCALPHSHAVCGGSLSTAGQIPADAERGPTDATLDVHNIAVLCSHMLVAGLQEWGWVSWSGDCSVSCS